MKGDPINRSPRIQVTLSPEVMAILDELSSLTGQGKATIVSGMMSEALPMLHGLADALRLVKSAPREAQHIISRVANEATMKLAQEQLSFDDLLSSKPRTKHQKRKRGPDGPT